MDQRGRVLIEWLPARMSEEEIEDFRSSFCEKEGYCEVFDVYRNFDETAIELDFFDALKAEKVASKYDKFRFKGCLLKVSAFHSRRPEDQDSMPSCNRGPASYPSPPPFHCEDRNFQTSSGFDYLHRDEHCVSNQHRSRSNDPPFREKWTRPFFNARRRTPSPRPGRHYERPFSGSSHGRDHYETDDFGGMEDTRWEEDGFHVRPRRYDDRQDLAVNRHRDAGFRDSCERDYIHDRKYLPTDPHERNPSYEGEPRNGFSERDLPYHTDDYREDQEFGRNGCGSDEQLLPLFSDTAETMSSYFLESKINQGKDFSVGARLISRKGGRLSYTYPKGRQFRQQSNKPYHPRKRKKGPWMQQRGYQGPIGPKDEQRSLSRSRSGSVSSGVYQKCIVPNGEQPPQREEDKTVVRNQSLQNSFGKSVNLSVQLPDRAAVGTKSKLEKKTKVPVQEGQKQVNVVLQELESNTVRNTTSHSSEREENKAVKSGSISQNCIKSSGNTKEGKRTNPVKLPSKQSEQLRALDVRLAKPSDQGKSATVAQKRMTEKCVENNASKTSLSMAKGDQNTVTRVDSVSRSHIEPAIKPSSGVRCGQNFSKDPQSIHVKNSLPCSSSDSAISSDKKQSDSFQQKRNASSATLGRPGCGDKPKVAPKKAYSDAPAKLELPVLSKSSGKALSAQYPTKTSSKGCVDASPSLGTDNVEKGQHRSTRAGAVSCVAVANAKPLVEITPDQSSSNICNDPVKVEVAAHSEMSSSTTSELKTTSSNSNAPSMITAAVSKSAEIKVASDFRQLEKLQGQESLGAPPEEQTPCLSSKDDRRGVSLNPGKTLDCGSQNTDLQSSSLETLLYDTKEVSDTQSKQNNLFETSSNTLTADSLSSKTKLGSAMEGVTLSFPSIDETELSSFINGSSHNSSQPDLGEKDKTKEHFLSSPTRVETSVTDGEAIVGSDLIVKLEGRGSLGNETKNIEEESTARCQGELNTEFEDRESVEKINLEFSNGTCSKHKDANIIDSVLVHTHAQSSFSSCEGPSPVDSPRKQAPATASDVAECFLHINRSIPCSPRTDRSAGDKETLNENIFLQVVEPEAPVPDSLFSRKEDNACEEISSALKTENEVIVGLPHPHCESAGGLAPTSNREVKPFKTNELSDIFGAQVSSSSNTPKTGRRDREIDLGSGFLQPLSEAGPSSTDSDELKIAESNVQHCDRDKDFTKMKSNVTCTQKLDAIETSSTTSKDVAPYNPEDYVNFESNGVVTHSDIILHPEQSCSYDQQRDNKGDSTNSSKQECEGVSVFLKETMVAAAALDHLSNAKMTDCASAPKTECESGENQTQIKDNRKATDEISQDSKQENVVYSEVRKNEMPSDLEKVDCSRLSLTADHLGVTASTSAAADEANNSELSCSRAKKEAVKWKRVVKLFTTESSASSSHKRAVQNARTSEMPVKSVSPVQSPEREILVAQSVQSPEIESLVAQSRAVSVLQVHGDHTSSSSQMGDSLFVKNDESVCRVSTISGQPCNDTRFVEVNQSMTDMEDEDVIGKEVGVLEEKCNGEGNIIEEPQDFSQRRSDIGLKSAVEDVGSTSPTITKRTIVLHDTVRGYSEFGRQAQGDLDEGSLLPSTEELQSSKPSLLSVAPVKKKPLRDHLEANSPGRNSPYAPECSKENTWSSFGRDNWVTYDRSMDRLSSFDVDLRHLLKVRKRKQRDEIEVTRYTDGSQQDLRLKLRKSNAPELTVLISQNHPGAAETVYSDFEIDKRRVKQKRSKMNKEDEEESRKKKKRKRRRDTNSLLSIPLLEAEEEIGERELKRRLRKLAKQRKYEEKMGKGKGSKLRSCITPVEELISKNSTSFHDRPTEQDSRELKLNQGEYFTSVSDDELDIGTSTKSSEGGYTPRSPSHKENVPGKLSSVALERLGDGLLVSRQASSMPEDESQVPCSGTTVLAGQSTRELGRHNGSNTEHEVTIVCDSVTRWRQLEESPVFDDNNNNNIRTDLLLASARAAATVAEDDVEDGAVLSCTTSPCPSQKSQVTKVALVIDGNHDASKCEDTSSELRQGTEHESICSRQLLVDSTMLHNDECNEITVKDGCYEEMTDNSSISHHSEASVPEPLLTFSEGQNRGNARSMETQDTVSPRWSINNLLDVDMCSEQASASPLECVYDTKTDSVSVQDDATSLLVSCPSSVNSSEDQRCQEDEECFYSQISSVSTLGYDALSESDSLLADKEAGAQEAEKSTEHVTNLKVQKEHAQKIGEDLLDRFTKDSRAITAIVSMLLRKMPDMEDILALGLADVLDELGDECVRDFKSRCPSY